MPLESSDPQPKDGSASGKAPTPRSKIPYSFTYLNTNEALVQSTHGCVCDSCQHLLGMAPARLVATAPAFRVGFCRCAWSDALGTGAPAPAPLAGIPRDE